MTADPSATFDDGWEVRPPAPSRSDVQQKIKREQAAQARLTALTKRPGLEPDPKFGWAPARRLSETATLLGQTMLAARMKDMTNGAADDVDPADIGAALSLIDQARRDLEKLETQLIIEARGRDQTWRRIAEYQGLETPQSAIQRYQRQMARLQELAERGVR